ncbi:hypothetical protein BU24DRAFT_484066 [Aaosphaeria arxii CBS 175.79]|uniref:UbiA prenyltransferase n=1 Tax=Aaosphaeria arxii CBS 175.79 TaxID=1450172 RepID=A0A6A5XHH1_9PLEO|nr:uncharacterized protein BU24DRAFT_484066 [Aaosphaeria arxii CBS 175.79]KAF2012413.1 hypothetical protein BU24DRAFT_484066 [Aaosphaeria arxii CBS 175.79]
MTPSRIGAHVDILLPSTKPTYPIIKMTFVYDKLLSLQPLWQLSRFDTYESWLACYPAVWGLSLAINHYQLEISQGNLLLLVIYNWCCMTIIHAAFCTWNDIVDANIDRFAIRTASRPLPSGRYSVFTARLWFIAQVFLASSAVHVLLGIDSLYMVLPCFGLAFVYPLSKQYIQWPQFVLAPTVGWPIFIGWISVQTRVGIPERLDLSVCVPAFLSYATWTIYYDTCYGFQDIAGDKESGVGSLAQYLGIPFIKPFLLGVNVTSLLLLGLGCERSGCSMLFKYLGIGFWALSVPYQFYHLDLQKPSSGGRIFLFNIRLGLYITIAILVDTLHR